MNAMPFSRVLLSTCQGGSVEALSQVPVATGAAAIDASAAIDGPLRRLEVLATPLADFGDLFTCGHLHAPLLGSGNL